jgi:hypothetical protein
VIDPHAFIMIGIGFGAAAGMGACTGNPAPAAMPPMAHCELGDSAMVRDILYFGRNRPAGVVVTDAEWQTFLDQVVTPRFPAGLTVISASGQWRGHTGQVERERAGILTLFHAGDEPARRAVEDVMAEYKRRFQQEAVLRERTTTCARFGTRSMSGGLLVSAIPGSPSSTRRSGDPPG